MPSHIILQVNADREDVVLQFCTHRGVPSAAQEKTKFSQSIKTPPIREQTNQILEIRICQSEFQPQ